VARVAFKGSSSKRKGVVLLIEVQISPCGFVCEREESSVVSEFQVKNKII